MAEKERQNELRKLRVTQDMFSGAKSLCAAIDVAWKSDFSLSPMYQHYTTLPKLLHKIISRRWYLSRADSPWMNDTHEMTKAFPGCRKARKRTYIMCLSQCTSESVAMWRTYNATEDPFAVRVSMPRGKVHEWMKSVKERGIRVDGKKALGNSSVEWVNFHDVLYGALKSEDESDEYDIKRRNVVRWGDAVYGLKEGKENEKRDNFADVDIPGCEAWVKDYEWHHERESRLCIRLKKENKAKSLSIEIPPEILQAMRITFSPWLMEKRLEDGLKNVIEAALKSSLEGEGGLITLNQRFRRSTLKGALNFRG